MKSYFTIEELCASETARKFKINNTPSDEIKKHLQELINFLNPIREALGKAITVSSGYRCKELNEKVKGVANSAHTVGYGVDLQCKLLDTESLFFFMVGYLKGAKLMFDQLLLERSGATIWVHFSLKGTKGEQRCQIKEIFV